MQIAWDEEEDEFLTRYYGEYTAPEIAKMLGRTVASIKNRVNKLNIKLSYWYKTSSGLEITNYQN